MISKDREDKVDQIGDRLYLVMNWLFLKIERKTSANHQVYLPNLVTFSKKGLKTKNITSISYQRMLKMKY